VQFREGTLPVRRSLWFYVHSFIGSAKSDPRGREQVYVINLVKTLDSGLSWGFGKIRQLPDEDAIPPSRRPGYGGQAGTTSPMETIESSC
jgi:hypothetical protein